MMSRWLLMTVSVAVATACSNGPTENGDSGSNAGLAPERLVNDVAAAQCQKMFECCTTEELGEVFSGLDVDDEASCEEAIQVQSDAFLRPALQHAVEQDRVEILEDGLSSCVNAIADQDCADFRPRASADVLTRRGCTNAVEPQLTLSAFCSEDFECETRFCSRPAAETEGACKNPPKVDEPCINDRCGDGLVCGVDGFCVEKLGLGALCTRNADCDSDRCSPNDDGELVCVETPEICTGS